MQLCNGFIVQPQTEQTVPAGFRSFEHLAAAQWTSQGLFTYQTFQLMQFMLILPTPAQQSTLSIPLYITCITDQCPLGFAHCSLDVIPTADHQNIKK